jgi:hypothetical protein
MSRQPLAFAALNAAPNGLEIGLGLIECGGPGLFFFLGLDLLLLLGDRLLGWADWRRQIRRMLHRLQSERHQIVSRCVVTALACSNCESKKPSCLLVVAQGRPYQLERIW